MVAAAAKWPPLPPNGRRRRRRLMDARMTTALSRFIDALHHLSSATKDVSSDSRRFSPLTSPLRKTIRTAALVERRVESDSLASSASASASSALRVAWSDRTSAVLSRRHGARPPPPSPRRLCGGDIACPSVVSVVVSGRSAGWTSVLRTGTNRASFSGGVGRWTEAGASLVVDPATMDPAILEPWILWSCSPGSCDPAVILQPALTLTPHAACRPSRRWPPPPAAVSSWRSAGRWTRPPTLPPPGRRHRWPPRHRRRRRHRRHVSSTLFPYAQLVHAISYCEDQVTVPI